MRNNINIIHSRIENIYGIKFDYIISRALAKLKTLLFYSLPISHKDTKLVFLKGQKLKNEIYDAKKEWKFSHLIKKSISDQRGKIIKITNFKQTT